LTRARLLRDFPATSPCALDPRSATNAQRGNALLVGVMRVLRVGPTGLGREGRARSQDFGVCISCRSSMSFWLVLFFLIIILSRRDNTESARSRQSSLVGLRDTFSFVRSSASQSIDRSLLFTRKTSLLRYTSRIEAKSKQAPTTLRHQKTTATMHLPTTTSLINLLFLTTTISLQVVLASPLSFTDIERRWSAGETDVSPKKSHPSNLHIPEDLKLTPLLQRPQSTPPTTPAPPLPPGRSP
jgi:hypothetical protein